MQAVKAFADIFTAKTSQLVDWNTQVLARILHDCVARRVDSGAPSSNPKDIVALEQKYLLDFRSERLVLDEVEEIIDLPQFDSSAKSKTSPNSIELDKTAMVQLRNYVQTIAAMYHPNPFHNF
jgi:hypothetical protein